MTHLNAYLIQNSFVVHDIKYGSLLHLMECFRRNIQLYKRIFVKIRGRPWKNYPKKAYLGHVRWPMCNKCWPKVNMCWLFWSFDTFMFKIVSKLSPDSKSCLEQNLWSFEVCAFLNVLKKAKKPMSYLGTKGLRKPKENFEA